MSQKRRPLAETGALHRLGRLHGAGRVLRQAFLAAVGLATLVLAAHAASAGSVGPANYTADTTWAAAESPFFVDGDIGVGSAANLTIEAGVTVIFNGTYELRIQGGLQARGTAASPILLTYSNVTFPKWKGVVIVAPTFPVNLDNVTFKRVSYAVTVDRASGGVELWNLNTDVASPYNPALYVDRVLTVLNSNRIFAGRIYAKDAVAGVNISNSSNITLYNLTCASMRGGSVQGKCLSAWLAPDLAVDRLLSSGADVWLDRSPRASLSSLSIDVLQQSALLTIARSNGTLVYSLTLANYRYEGLLIANSEDSRIDRATLTAYPGAFTTATAVSVAGSADIAFSNLSISYGARAFHIDACPRFLLENITTRNVDFVDLDIAHSGGGSIVRNYGGMGPYGGIRLNTYINPSEADFDIDFSRNVSVRGSPILGLYKQPNVTLPSGVWYTWFYAFSSPGLRGDGITVPWSVSYSNIHLIASAGASLRNVTYSDFHVLNSSDLELAGLCCGRLYVSSSSNISIHDSWISVEFTDWQTALELGGLTDVRLFNVSALGPSGASGRSLLVSGVTNLTVSGGFFRGALPAIIGSSTNVQLYGTRFCSNSTSSWGLDIQAPTGGLASNVSFCSSRLGFRVAGGTGFTIENSTFNGLTTAITISPSGGNTIRWNNFTACQTLGISHASAGADLIYENNFRCAAASAVSTGGGSWPWANATSLHGNFWDDYNGTDTNGDSIGDRPYLISPRGQPDPYPLFYPWETVPPVARVPAPFAVNEDVPVVLNGSASSDNLGLRNATWTIFDGPSTYERPGLVANHTFATPGLFAVRLIVFDRWGLSDTAWTNVTVRDVTPPSFPSPPAEVEAVEDVPFEVALEVLDNDPLFPAGAHFNWTLSGRESGFWAEPAPSVNLTLVEPGNYSLRLTASDGSGRTSSVDIAVRVADVTAPQCTVVASGAADVGEGGQVTFALQCTDNDLAFPAAPRTDWSWRTPSGLVANFTGLALDLSVPDPGTYTIGWTCPDGSGNTAEGNLSLVVRDTAGPRWTAPLNLTFGDGESHTLSVADAWDFTGLADALWERDGALLGAGLNLSVRFSGLGLWRLRVLINDPLGNAAAYPFEVRVEDRSAPQLADASFQAVRALELGEIARLVAGNSFTDNDPLFSASATFLWGGPPEAVWEGPPSGPSIAVGFPRAGTYAVWLNVSDAAGNALNLTLPITVRDTRPPSGLRYTVRPGLTVAEGTQANLSAAAQDLSGVTFRWTWPDGTTDTGGSLTHQFTVVGTIRIKLTATDGAGNAVNASFDVVVQAAAPEPPGSTGTSEPSGLPAADPSPLAVLVVLAAGGFAVASFALVRRRSRPPRTLK